MAQNIPITANRSVCGREAVSIAAVKRGCSARQSLLWAKLPPRLPATSGDLQGLRHAMKRSSREPGERSVLVERTSPQCNI